MHVVGLDNARIKVSVNVVQNIPFASVFTAANCRNRAAYGILQYLDLHVNENGRVIILVGIFYP